MKSFYRLLSFAMLLGACAIQARHMEDVHHAIQVGPTFNFARYKFGDLPKTQGYLAGIHFDAMHDLSCNFFAKLKFDGRWNAGFICGENDLKVKIRDYRPELDLGYSFVVGACDQFSLVPFAGVGFYYLSHKLSPEDTTRRYFNVYVPVGVMATWFAKEHFDVGLSAYYRVDAWTRLKVKTPAITNNDKLKLKRTQGVLVEMPLTWHHERCGRVNFHTKVVPFFDWNRFGKSKEVNTNGIRVPVPKLQDWYLGLHVDVGIDF